MKKLTSPVKKVNSQVIGLDVHKQMIAYRILDRAGTESQLEAGAAGAVSPALSRRR